jgi:inosine-uridine nucleoside N-ribohydrolase
MCLECAMILPRALAVAAASMLLLGAASRKAVPRATAPNPPRPVPVILDTDIGDDIDDTWALALLLRSPGLDLRLVTTDYGNTVYRAKIVARILEIAGRTDVPIGIGIRENDREGGQAEWVRDYDLARYPGTVHEDGVQALIDTVMGSPEPMTLVAIGPPPSLAAALQREPRIAARLRLAGMFGSLRHGYGGKAGPEPEWNVRADLAAARAVIGAPWREAIFTPLDTCGLVQLTGDRYARIRDSKDPLLRAVIENYSLWCPHQAWCREDPAYVKAKSSTLFDPVAVYLAGVHDLVKTESLSVRVTDEGLTRADGAGPTRQWATEWRSVEGFEDLLVERLTAPARGR